MRQYKGAGKCTGLAQCASQTSCMHCIKPMGVACVCTRYELLHYALPECNGFPTYTPPGAILERLFASFYRKTFTRFFWNCLWKNIAQGCFEFVVQEEGKNHFDLNLNLNLQRIINCRNCKHFIWWRNGKQILVRYYLYPGTIIFFSFKRLH